MVTKAPRGHDFYRVVSVAALESAFDAVVRPSFPSSGVGQPNLNGPPPKTCL